PGRRLQYRRAEHLIGQRPLIGGRPTREVARPHLSGDDQRILRPCLRLSSLDRNTDIQATAHPPKPSVLRPARQLLSRRVGIDAQYGGSLTGRHESASPSQKPGKLLPTYTAYTSGSHTHAQTSLHTRVDGLRVSDPCGPLLPRECELLD